MALSAGAVVAQFDGDFKGLNKGLQQAQSKVDGFTKDLNGAGKKIGNVFKSIGQAAINYGKILGAVGGTALGFAIKNASELQALATNFEVLTGSAEKGKKVFQDLKKLGAVTPFSTTDLAKATQTMLAFGIETKDVEKNLRMLGDVSLGNKDKLAGLTLAFSQMKAVGKLTGEDLNQMIERGFNPLTIMAEKSGKSVAQLRDEMSKGKITVEDVTKAFEIATSEGGQFYQGMEKGSQTLSGKFSTLWDGISNMSAGILGLKDDGTILEGSLMSLVEKGVDYLNERLGAIDWVKVGQDINNTIVNAIQKVRDKLQELADFYTNHKMAIDFLIGAFAALVTQLAIVRTALIIYNSLMVLSTILSGGFAVVIGLIFSKVGLVIGIISLLVGGLVMMIRNWEKMPAPIQNFGNTLVFWFKTGWNAINTVINLLKTLMGTLNNIKMPTGLQKIFDVIKGITGMGGGKGFKIPGFADGVRNFSGGLAIVGERGPELVNLPKGADVFTNEESRRMTAGGGGITIETMNIKSGVDWELGASYMAQKLRLS